MTLTLPISKKLVAKGLVISGLVLIVFASIGTSTYYYNQYKKALNQNPLSELDTILTNLGKVMELPEEKPALATVTNKDELLQQGFFNKAQNGDKVLIFSLARKAILYRPSSEKIIDIAPIQALGEASSSGQVAGVNVEEGSGDEIEVSSVVIYNGTFVSGLARKVSNLLKGSSLGVAVIGGTNAQVKDYQDTLIVDLTGANKEKAQKLADFLSARVSQLPASESSPDAELLVIIGRDLIDY